MTPIEFVKTIYLGDRGCESVLVDALNNTVKLKIDCISRVRSPTGFWSYYNDEDCYLLIYDRIFYLFSIITKSKNQGVFTTFASFLFRGVIYLPSYSLFNWRHNF